MTNVPLSTGLPETVLPPAPSSSLEGLAGLAAAGPARVAGLKALVAANPTFLEGWAELAATAGDPVEAYAYARVGYHRGLDTLRGAGWRGSGYVRWRNETNRGFLKSLDALRKAAAAIGEEAEATRCELFLKQLDPDWPAGT